MINPSKISKCKIPVTLSEFVNKGSTTEKFTVSVNDFTYMGYTDNVIVKNKHGRELKNKRLEVNKTYTMRCKWSIVLDCIVVVELKEL